MPQPEPTPSLGMLGRLGSLFRTYAIPADSLVLPGPFENDDRSCFTFLVPPEWTSDEDGVSTLQLLEDGQHLGPAGANHDDIRTLGKGRFSHWGPKVYFSTSDGSDPNTNGRVYSIVPPADWSPGEGNPFTERRSMKGQGDTLDVEWAMHDLSAVDMGHAGGHAYRFAVRGDWPSDDGSLSTLLVLEDGKPLPHPHVDAKDVEQHGQGRYTHRGDRVLFSSSDGSDPRRNGKSYQYAHAHAFVLAHARQAPFRDQGKAWVIAGLPTEWESDADGGTSRVRILEDGKLLGPHAAGHDAIREQGGGRYSHWGDSIWFSTSDDTDPTTNGRTYTVVLLDGED